ncbi:MAG: hypothetical protein HQK58_14380, partial [Deltaproteobacteria bacterium]|nr:hypothetical protein [Deltaproteobacteria bacterium]
MKKSIFVLSVLLFVFGLFLPVCHAATSSTGCVFDTRDDNTIDTGCVFDTRDDNTMYDYVVEQVGTRSAAYFTIRGTVTSYNSTSNAFPGTINGYMASNTSDIYFTVVYGNNTGSRSYVIYRSGNGAGISWAVDATGAISDPAQPIKIMYCPPGGPPNVPPTCTAAGRWCDNHNGTVTDKTTG